MFDNIFAAIEKWMRELLSGMVESNLSTMFTAVNQQTSEIAAQVGQTPQGWNSSIFSMIRNISDSVVIPIAGIIITLILCYELISMLTETLCNKLSVQLVQIDLPALFSIILLLRNFVDRRGKQIDLIEIFPQADIHKRLL